MRRGSGLGLTFICFTFVFSTACSSFGQKMKSFLGGKSPVQVTQIAPKITKFSEQPNASGVPKRQYKRMTRTRLEEEALLQAGTGSLWVMEGQGAYLFSQNIVRMIGDPIGVTIEGEPREQLQAKVDVISDLIQKLEKRVQARLRTPAAEAQSANEPPAGQENPASEKAAGSKGDFSVKTVPTRVIERTVDGNYRVKGSQPFMIGSREYQVIVTGIVRAEDFSEDGISASRLLDPKFDVVSFRGREKSL